MTKLKFIFGIHNHQPVGNFDFVFQEAYNKAYLPFLDMAAQYPWFRFTMHNSGCLWEWLEINRPEYFDKVGALVKSGQLELMGGGFYEPILPAIPERDRRGQIQLMSEYLKERFGRSPAGAWLAERVWEPCLASTLANAGIKYTVLDDYHFKCAGKQEKDLNGYYLTEDQGRNLSVFPISQKLRYMVPFYHEDEVIAYLRGLYELNNDSLAILADDGEKLGIWPGTYDHVYTNGWLKRFFEKLSHELDWIELTTFSDIIKETPPSGRVYLPTGSYTEMGEWVLEPESEEIYQELTERLKSENSYDRYSPYIRGGIWRNYLVKYPEANNIYRKMLHVSDKIQGFGPEATRELYKGQCNCGYWHGIFGGIYLPHLREALYRHLIRAEVIRDKAAGVEGPAVEKLDFDGDGQDEFLLSNKNMNVYLAPASGAAIYEWDIRDKEINLLDTLSRRRENYHRKINQAGSGNGGQGKSIHEVMTAKQEGLEKFIHYDRFRRIGLVDHLLGNETNIESFSAGQYKEMSDDLQSQWTAKAGKIGGAITAEFVKKTENLQITKEVVFGPGKSVQVNYQYLNTGKELLGFWPGIEFNFGLLASGPGRFCRAKEKLSTERLDIAASDSNLTQLAIYDEHRRLTIDFTFSDPMDLWRFPVETVSLSESGLEKNYQCSCFLWHKRLKLEAGAISNLTFEIGYSEV